MSLKSQNEFYESLYREKINEVDESVYTPEYFEYEGVDVSDQFEKSDKTDYLETFRLQSVMYDSVKDNIRNGKVGKSILNILASLCLGVVNTALFIFGLICITLTAGFTPVSEDEIYIKKSVKGA